MIAEELQDNTQGERDSVHNKSPVMPISQTGLLCG